MNKQEFINNIEDTFKECLNIVRKKNADYSGSDIDQFKNFSAAEIVGVSTARGILVRIMDKINRISNLIDNEAQVSDETINDTIIDMIGYAAILKAYLSSDYKIINNNQTESLSDDIIIVYENMP